MLDCELLCWTVSCKLQTLVYDIFPCWKKVPESDVQSVYELLSCWTVSYHAAIRAVYAETMSYHAGL